MFMTAFLQQMIDDGQPVQSVIVDGGWLEVDTCDDLDVYRALHERGALSQFVRLGEGTGA